jgi:hypothetical protein
LLFSSTNSYLPHRLSVPLDDVDCHSPSLINVEEINITTNIAIYPNPSDYSLTLEMILDNDEGYMVEVLDLAGKLLIVPIKIKGNEKRIVLDVSKFISGIYFLKFTNHKGSGTTLFVKN